MQCFRSLFIISSILILVSCSKDSDGTSEVNLGSSSSSYSGYGNTQTAAATQYSLTVTAGVGGSVSTSGGTYDDGTIVTITATPNDGYEFTGWNGSDSSNATIDITINSNTTLEALFSEVVTQYSLTVSAGVGGSVSTSGGTYDDGTIVTITATPNDGYEFTGWNGSDSSNATIDITINSNTTLEALFSEVVTQYSLTVSAGVGGSVSTSGGTYDDGTIVTITATPNDGYEFTGWNGSDSSNATIDITINSNTTLEALFSEVQATSTTSSTYSIDVTAQSSSNYILSGSDQNGNVSGNDPSISAKVGDTFTFNVNSPGHPFYLIIVSNGGIDSNNLINGVTNNGSSSGTISWSPTEAGTYYYICEYHPSMLGTITITE